jgi:hypothetical protein
MSPSGYSRVDAGVPAVEALVGNVFVSHRGADTRIAQRLDRQVVYVVCPAKVRRPSPRRWPNPCAAGYEVVHDGTVMVGRPSKVSLPGSATTIPDVISARSHRRLEIDLEPSST